MDLCLAEIQNEIDRELAQNGTQVVLTWDVYAQAPDPVTGDRGTPTPGTLASPAFVHYVAPAVSSVRQFNEVQVGDVILDFASDVDLAGKENVRFNVKGKLYVARKLSNELGAAWDVMVGGVQLFRTVLVRPIT